MKRATKLPTVGIGARRRPVYTAEPDVPTITLVRGRDGRLVQAIVSGRHLTAEEAYRVKGIVSAAMKDGVLAFGADWRVRVI